MCFYRKISFKKADDINKREILISKLEEMDKNET